MGRQATSICSALYNWLPLIGVELTGTTRSELQHRRTVPRASCVFAMAELVPQCSVAAQPIQKHGNHARAQVRSDSSESQNVLVPSHTIRCHRHYNPQQSELAEVGS